MSNKSKLLFDSNPLIVVPELAVLIGLNESIILQQIHYWIQKSSHVLDGRVWVYNSIPQWLEQFPFWSEKTLKRTFTSLKEKSLIVTGNYNKLKQDRTLWYAINYDVLEALQEKAPKRHKKPSGQNDPMVGSESQEPSNPHKRPWGHFDLMVGSFCPHEEVILTRPIPETATETSPETSSRSFEPKEDSYSTAYTTHTKKEAAHITTQQKSDVCENSSTDFLAFQKEVLDIIGQKVGLPMLEQLVRISSVERIRYHLQEWHIHKQNQTKGGAGYFITVILNDIEPLTPEKRQQQYYSSNQKPQRDNFEQREYTDEEFEKFYANLVE